MTDDLISRQAAIDALARKCIELDSTKRFDEGTGCGIAKEIIENLPTAEPRWIPVTERLPEKWGTLENACAYVFAELCNNKLFMGVYDAKNGPDDFMCGVATVMQFIAYKASKEIGDMYSKIFAVNMSESKGKVEAEGEDDGHTN